MSWWPDWLDWALIGDAILGLAFVGYILGNTLEWIEDTRENRSRWWRDFWRYPGPNTLRHRLQTHLGPKIRRLLRGNHVDR